MFKVIYYNLDSKQKEIKFESKSLAICQYNLLKNKYQYSAVIKDNKIIIGKLLEDYNKN